MPMNLSNPHFSQLVSYSMNKRYSSFSSLHYSVSLPSLWSWHLSQSQTVSSRTFPFVSCLSLKLCFTNLLLLSLFFEQLNHLLCLLAIEIGIFGAQEKAEIRISTEKKSINSIQRGFIQVSVVFYRTFPMRFDLVELRSKTSFSHCLQRYREILHCKREINSRIFLLPLTAGTKKQKRISPIN